MLKDRAWAYRVGSGAWTAVTGVPTANGSYDVRVVFDYKAKTGNCWIKTSAEGDASYHLIVSNFALTTATLNNAAVVGGGISEMNASYRTTAPAEVLPQGNAIVIDRNAEVRLENLTAGTSYAVQGVPAGKSPTFTTELPTGDGKVRYYRVEIELEK